MNTPRCHKTSEIGPADIGSLLPKDSWSSVAELAKEDRKTVHLSRQNELMAAIYRLEEDHESNLARLYSTLDRIRDTNPQSAIESAMAQQIEILRSFSLRSAAKAALHFENQLVAERYLAQLERINNQLLKFIVALTKLRSGNQQKVVVEHVNVSEGENAIVGNVSTSAGK